MENILYLGGIIGLSALSSAICTYAFVNFKNKKNGQEFKNKSSPENKNSPENISEIPNELNDIDSKPFTTFQPEWWKCTKSTTSPPDELSMDMDEWSMDMLNDFLNLDEGTYIFTKYGPDVYDIQRMTMQHVFDYAQLLSENPDLGGVAAGLVGAYGTYNFMGKKYTYYKLKKSQSTIFNRCFISNFPLLEKK